MMRRSLFLGFMIVLGSVLVYLVLSARKQEKKRTADRSTEIVLASKLSATRVVSPVDIEITGVRTEIGAPGTDEAGPGNAPMRCFVTIRNRGKVAYDRFMVRLMYTDPGSREESRSQAVSEKVAAGATVTLPQIEIGALSRRRSRVRADMVWADLASDEPLRAAKPATQ